MTSNPIVIKYGGSLLEEPGHRTTFLKDVVELSKKQKVILVHGGGKEISRQMEQAGLKPKFVDGRRYTDEATMAVVDRVLATINARIVDTLKKQGANAKGFSGKWKSVMVAEPLSQLGRVGEPKEVKRDILDQALLEADIPVFYPVAVDIDGKPLNINADDFAMALAIACKARRLVYLTDTGAILDKAGQPIELVTEKRVHQLIQDGTITGGMAVKSEACLQAVKKGVGRVDICKEIAGLTTATEQSLGGTGFII